MQSDEGGREKLHVGWDIEKMTESIATTHQKIQNLKTGITAVVGGLRQIRLAVSLALPPSGEKLHLFESKVYAGDRSSSEFRRIDAEVARRRLEQLRKEIADYKAQVGTDSCVRELLVG